MQSGDKLSYVLAGITDPAQIEALERAEREGTIMNVPELAPVVDADGDPLIVGEVYRKPGGDRFRLTRWQFGSGNFMDTYYWVWGIGEDLQEGRMTVDAVYRRGKPSYYPSQLQKTFKLEDLQDAAIRYEILRRRLVAVKEQG